MVREISHLRSATFSHRFPSDFRIFRKKFHRSRTHYSRGNFRFTSNFTGINGTSPNARPFPEFKISSRERGAEVDYNSSFRQRLSLYCEGKYYSIKANSAHYIEHSAQNPRVMCQLTLYLPRKFREKWMNVKFFFQSNQFINYV